MFWNIFRYINYLINIYNIWCYITDKGYVLVANGTVEITNKYVTGLLTKQILYEFVWRFIVVVHFAIVVLNLAAFFTIPWYEPFYVSVPIISFQFNLFFNRNWSCPLTEFEDKYRVLAGRQPIHKFVKYYIIKPTVRLNSYLKQNRRC